MEDREYRDTINRLEGGRGSGKGDLVIIQNSQNNLAAERARLPHTGPTLAAAGGGTTSPYPALSRCLVGGSGDSLAAIDEVTARFFSAPLELNVAQTIQIQ